MPFSTESRSPAITKYIADKESTKDVLDSFCKPIEEKYSGTDEPDIEGNLRELWQSVITTAQSTPFESNDRQEIVNFLLELRQRQHHDKDGKQQTAFDSNLWEGLPIFGWQMREAWNMDVSDKSDDVDKQRWINLNAWAASMTATALSKAADELDFSLYGIWTIRSGLEETTEPANIEIAAAAVWFIYASSSLWQLCTAEKSFDGKMAKPGRQFSSEEWRGFTKDRWQSWAQRFDDLEDHVTEQKTGQLLQSARRAMAAAARQ